MKINDYRKIKFVNLNRCMYIINLKYILFQWSFDSYILVGEFQLMKEGFILQNILDIKKNLIISFMMWFIVY